jgi:hypothetical protein
MDGCKVETEHGGEKYGKTPTEDSQSEVYHEGIFIWNGRAEIYAEPGYQ